jgi:hypothetical protein
MWSSSVILAKVKESVAHGGLADGAAEDFLYQ